MSKPAVNSGADDRGVPVAVRTIRLLALIATRDMSPADGAALLVRAGFTMTETGDLLGITKNAVNLAVRRKRAARQAPRARQRKPQG